MSTISKLVRAKFRVKIKSLAEEARIIRNEERRCVGRDSDRGCLADHRVRVVRAEQRATLLAYAFYRGVPYIVLESLGSKPVDAKAVLRIIDSLARYHRDAKELEAWLHERMDAAA